MLLCQSSSESPQNRTVQRKDHARHLGCSSGCQPAGHCEHQPSRCPSSIGGLDGDRSFEGHPTFEFQHLRMVYLPNGLLFEDHLDQRWEAVHGREGRRDRFPSRHVAVSGQASLTLHPVGVPHLAQGEVGPYGGVGGVAPPPSTRLAPWWKRLLEMAPAEPELAGFDLSLEVTHHGPVSTTLPVH